MPQLEIGFLIFPKPTQLDFTGPLQVLSRLPGARVHIVARSMAPVPSDCGLSLVPTTTCDECPQLRSPVRCRRLRRHRCGGRPGGARLRAPPGGVGKLRHLRLHRCLRARCRGLARRQAGDDALGLHGAATLVGATHERARAVRDGNVITAGGVTSGIDFGLTLVAEIAGRTVAETVQLSIEYDPHPPFDAGDPARAPIEVKASLADRYAKSLQAYREALDLARHAA